MKYYSRNPQELREDLAEQSRNESAKKRKSYGLQIANFGILLIVLLLAVRTPFFSKKKTEEQKSSGASVQRTMKWKEWNISTSCLVSKQCTLNLTKTQGSNGGNDIDAFYWQVADNNSGKVLMKSFELIPKNLGKNEERVFVLQLKDFVSATVELHFLDALNNEMLMLQIYP